MKNIFLNSSYEEELIKEFLNKNKFFNNLIYNLLNNIFTNKNINFIHIYICNNLKLNLSLNEKKIKFFSIDNNSYIKIIIYRKNKLGILSTFNLNYNKIHKMLNELIYSMKFLLKDKYISPPDYNLISFNIRDLNLFYPIKLKFNDKFNIISSIKNNIEKKYSVIKVKNINFNSNYKMIMFGNTYNTIQHFNTSYHQIDCEMFTKNKNFMNNKYDYINSRSMSLLNNINNFGLESSEELLKELNSTKIKTSNYPIILKNNIALDLFYNFSKSIYGKNVYLKSTFLLNYINKLILPKWMNIIEDPHILCGFGSSPFDNEGIKTYKKFIVKNGVLKNWLLDNYSSKRLNLKSTGNSGGIYNWIFNIEHNEINFINLLKELNNGILITNILGDGFNIYTGDYSQGISGFYIKNGKILYPISEITMSGNIINIFKNIIYMSNDYEYRNNINCGSLLIDNILISGI